MAGKRLFQDLESDLENKSEKRFKSLPLFASVFGALNSENTVTSFSSALVPLLRNVVRQEVERGVSKRLRSFSRSSSFRVEAPENIAPTLKLMFAKNIQTQPIFTGSKITDVDNTPLQVIIVDGSNNDHQIVPVNLDRPIRLDIVALHGDFPSGDKWSSDEFERNIVKERDGKRPLIAGEVTVTVRNGVGTIGNIEFTDNSRWVRSRKFRIGVKVAKGSSEQGVAVCEAMTEAFVVKDHRGELYKKHHPPMLEDEVWRLEKIGKDGPFHKKLSSENINNVQDFLKLSVVDLNRLRQIMSQMSDKIWDVTLKHARECILGNKLYIHSGPSFFLTLNPICEVMEAKINGQVFSSREALNQHHIKNLVRDANSKWNLLEVMERKTNKIPLLTQGDTMEQQYGPNHYHNNMEINRSYQQNGYAPERSTNTLEMINEGYTTMTPMEYGIYFNITGSSSQDHLNPFG
ncbi:protein SAR DEFICIENT 1 isoform X2 [Raphanus sativus]|uniref:Protein SAR DEFICIENT 1 isoform X2 n=1 Tax=Raphanus sativus TaxID=3726 RepID=A0A6J0KXY7_RAPSA|nr:protein SAR DEFICIENT 1 isoform X2 [Raphanus sativus]